MSIALVECGGTFDKPANAQDSPSPPTLEYLEDSRLQRTVTLEETGISLSQLLQRLKQKELQFQSAQPRSYRTVFRLALTSK